MNTDKTAMFDVHYLADEILCSFPNIAWRRESARNCVCLTLPNEQNPRFPLIVSIHSEEGIFVDLSRCGSIIECHTDISEVSKLINDVLNDKIAVAIAYPNEEKFESQIRPSMMCSFEFENEEDIVNFEKFITKISKPRAFLNRLNNFAFHGIIEVSDWSGNRYHIIYRK